MVKKLLNKGGFICQQKEKKQKEKQLRKKQLKEKQKEKLLRENKQLISIIIKNPLGNSQRVFYEKTSITPKNDCPTFFFIQPIASYPSQPF